MIEERGYRPIADYGAIGNAHTAALVAADGSIDWCCLPHFDSPAALCRLLDARRGGYFRVGPAGAAYATRRRYAGETNVLETTFSGADGTFSVTDFMPIEPRETETGRRDFAADHRILRIVQGIEGESAVEVAFLATFDFARATTALEVAKGGAIARSGPESLTLGVEGAPVFSRDGASGAAVTRFAIRAGERRAVSLAYGGGAGLDPAVDGRKVAAALDATLDFWRKWTEACRYDGPYAEIVRRSALALALLRFHPTGGLVAAPTTSLPEQIGGPRNYDYRYVWLRDAALILDALEAIGYAHEARDFFGWLDRLDLARRGKIRIMYTLDGREVPGEEQVEGLEGYRRSSPVRTGNGAADQTQLDVYGEVVDAAALSWNRLGSLGGMVWDEVRFFADEAARRWREPDHGMWEVRGGPRHFLSSKLHCWVALDRAARLAEQGGLEADIARWRKTADEVRRAILAEGWNAKFGAFTQSLGGDALDASALIIPRVGFLPASDPRVRSTVERIQAELTSGGLVYRYLTPDGMPGCEATFAACTFWLVDALALDGRIDEAREHFERVTAFANDLGLLAEEIDPASGEQLGNFPQGFTHLALVRAALHVERAERARRGARGRDSAAPT